jgi:hypothetical protein
MNSKSHKVENIMHQLGTFFFSFFFLLLVRNLAKGVRRPRGEMHLFELKKKDGLINIKLDSSSIGYHEVDKADRNIDARGAASKAIVDHFDGYNLKHHTYLTPFFIYFILFYLFYFILFNLMKIIRYEGLNLAEQSSVRNEEEKRVQDPFLRGIASARARRSELVYQKRKEAESPAPEMDVVTVNAREFAMPPEDSYPIGEKSL